MFGMRICCIEESEINSFRIDFWRNIHDEGENQALFNKDEQRKLVLYLSTV